MDITKWGILSLLDPEFIKAIQVFCVFGSAGNEAIIITKDDEAYGLGSNCCCCLALTDTHGSLLPKKILALCNKGMIDFAYGSGPHVLGLTKDGELYSWGHNGYCQLGSGCTNQGFTPSLVNTNIVGKKVTKVVCGSHHSMVLTSDGEIYAWGQNNSGQIGSGTQTNQPTPRKVSAYLSSKRAIDVACGQTSSMAVLENGEVYSWGYNGNGQLGLGNNTNQSNPCRVNGLPSIIIKVVCGYAHTLALSDEGELYAWGSNSYGQLGTGNKANLVFPTVIAKDIGRIVEIAAIHYNHLSAAMTQTAKVFMWGQCRGQCCTSPVETRFKKIDYVFACFGSPAVTWRPFLLDSSKTISVAESIRNSFDDELTSDLKFLVEEKYIFVHKSILKIRCEHFQAMFQSHWNEDDKKVIEITQFPYSVYRAFLQYLYMDYADISCEEAIGLLDLANSYCEPQLKVYCEQIIKQGITVENGVMLYAAAIKYQAKELEEFCFKFALNHMTAVTQTEAFFKLDEMTVKNFIQKAAQEGAFKY